jgi:hypothetical protein
MATQLAIVEVDHLQCSYVGEIFNAEILLARDAATTDCIKNN